MAKNRRPITRKVKEIISDLPDSFESPESSLIVGASYNKKTWELLVRFKRTREISDTYSHPNISPALWKGFVEAESKGVYYNKAIRLISIGKMVRPPVKLEPSPVI